MRTRQRAFFRHCGGDVIAGRDQALDTRDICVLHDLYADEFAAALASGDGHEAARALELGAELRHAWNAALLWRRAARARA